MIGFTLFPGGVFIDVISNYASYTMLYVAVSAWFFTSAVYFIVNLVKAIPFM